MDSSFVTLASRADARTARDSSDDVNIEIKYFFDELVNEQDQSDSNAYNIQSNTVKIENRGRWSEEEHRIFLDAVHQYGRRWKKIAGILGTRTAVQVRTHALKYYAKLARAKKNATSKLENAGAETVVDADTMAPVARDSSPVAKENTAESDLRVDPEARASPRPPSFAQEEVGAETRLDADPATPAPRSVSPDTLGEAGAKTVLSVHPAVPAPHNEAPIPPKEAGPKNVLNADHVTPASRNESPANAANVKNTGRWSMEEHHLFLGLVLQYGRDWNKISTSLQTRSEVQVRTHTQKYYAKLSKTRQKRGAESGGIALTATSGIGDATSEAPKECQTAAASTNTARWKTHEDHQVPKTGVTNESPNECQSKAVKVNTGRWKPEEHILFLVGALQHGRDWEKIAEVVNTRSAVQVRTHAQKFLQRRMRYYARLQNAQEQRNREGKNAH